MAVTERGRTQVEATDFLNAEPTVVHVVPLTSTIRRFHSEVIIEPDPTNSLSGVSVAQCQHLRAVSPGRTSTTRGNVGPAVLEQIRETIAVLLELPG
ncbi:hypothetical protein BH24ACT3_BH24ACT3_09430 [soil metagenome]